MLVLMNAKVQRSRGTPASLIVQDCRSIGKDFGVRTINIMYEEVLDQEFTQASNAKGQKQATDCVDVKGKQNNGQREVQHSNADGNFGC
ncbi:hypothetical protein CTI12_AA144480 [Artemisia annua]|uniref:Uncharacterized protein n=1 Tax=Artemisia annua TaxID=35608 RepID=A0A2U1P3F7_ARTAN|nr:hypothetical protein CTI12_AA144480 [Artemisia annua]